ncbi:MAG: acetolactate synthase small subunit [Nevskiaceae bacterium]|jgi:acetolactate synthase-1/3 small subunit|nr:acetolactate synthase small subunit [Nevskiaceae bacterium]
MRHIIGILLQNESGALLRVAGLFSNRGYNIESLSVATTDDATVSRITLVTTGSEAAIQQIVAQLNKLIDVLAVDDMTSGDHLERELVLVKLRVAAGRREALARQVAQAGGRVLNEAPDSTIVELCASEAEATRFMREAAQFGPLLEVVRSGTLGISRRAGRLGLDEAG